MGYYIDPKTMSKEAWLAEHGTEVSLNAINLDFDRLAPKEVVVVLMDNGPFTAVGIAYSKEELEVFTSPTDYRFKQYFIVGRQDILDVCPEVEGMLQ